MSDEDAEWIETNIANRPPTRRPPIRPRPQPRDEPEIPFEPPHDAPERESPSSGYSSTVIISASVVSSFVAVLLIILLLYLFVLKKKLKKAKKGKSESEFCIRVEDVTHLDIGDTADMYVNTTDLQKLVSSVRIKNQHPLPPKFQNEPPEIVRINKPRVCDDKIYDIPTEVTTPSDISYGSINNELADNHSQFGRPPAQLPIANFQTISNSKNMSTTSNVLRSAPPPPVLETKNNFVPLDSSVQSDSNISEEPPNSELDAISKLRPLLAGSKYPPHVLPKPSVTSNQNVPLTVLEPQLKTGHRTKLVKHPPPTPPKPSAKDAQNKHNLPLLSIRPLPSVIRQDSGFATPDTAVSYVSDSDGTANSSFEPETMSVTAKRAFLEGALAQEMRKNKHY